MVATKTFMSDEELMLLPDDGSKYEFMEGGLKMSPTGLRHEIIGAKLIYKLYEFVEMDEIGYVCGSSAGYRMKSGNALSPDVSFVRKSRLKNGESLEGFGNFAPDLAVEILSPSEKRSEITGKIKEYFENGSELVWIIDPKKRTATVYHSYDSYSILKENESLSGENVIPGFSCYLAGLLK